ncbi:MAG: acyl-CoA dehydratase activase-related protein [Enterocloster clostridioformis]
MHGHVTWLIKQGVKFIFYPCIPYGRNESPDARQPLQPVPWSPPTRKILKITWRRWPRKTCVS